MANEGAEKPGRTQRRGDGSLAPNGDGAYLVRARRRKMKPAGYFEGESMTRRALFTGGAMAAGGIAGAAIILPAIGFALGPVFEQKEARWQDVGASGDFPDDKYLPRTITLTEVSGTPDSRRSTYAGEIRAFPRERQDEFIAISTRCSHAGCPVRWVNAARALRLSLSRRRLRFRGQGRGRAAGAAARQI